MAVNTLQIEASPLNAADVLDAVVGVRRAVRRFLPRPVPMQTVREILEVARWAPSGTNIQPWRCRVVTGAARERLCEATVRALRAEAPRHQAEYAYYPAAFPQPYLARRMAFGAALGGALGIAQADAEARARQLERNFRFFDAPVGLIFTMDRGLEQGSLLDYGGFLQTVMLAAKARGLDTCAQQSWCQFHRVIRAELGVGEDETVVCGMALGFADPAAPENALNLSRAPVDEFAAFLGDDPRMAAA